MNTVYKIIFGLATLVVLAAIILLFAEAQPAVAPTNNSVATVGTVPNVSPTRPVPPPQTESPLLKHDVYITFSADPASFPVGTLVTKSGSVPDVLVCTVTTTTCNVGDLLIYFVDPLAKQPSAGVSMIKSTDGGKTWSARQTITLANKQNQGPVVDPSVMQLSDGRIRLYFFAPDGPLTGGPADTTLHNVDSAVSNDGIAFTVESGVRFSAQHLTDPEVITNGKEWFMYYSIGIQSGVATSTDGLSFTEQGTLPSTIGGVPGAIVLKDGSIRAYGCTPTGIASGTSTDGLTFSSVVTALSAKQICDPSVQPLGDQYVMVYKLVNP